MSRTWIRRQSVVAGLAVLAVGMADSAQAEGELVRVRLEAESKLFSYPEGAPPNYNTPTLGPVIAQVNVGDVFYITVFLRDIRIDSGGGGDQFGVFASYGNVQFDPGKVSVEGAIAYSRKYPHGPNGTANNSQGVVSNVGSFFAGLSPPGTAEELQLAIPFRAKAPGVVEFVAGPPAPAHGTETLVFGDAGSEVPPEFIEYMSTTSTIRPVLITGINIGTNGTCTLVWTNLSCPASVEWTPSLEGSSSWHEVAGPFSNHTAAVALPTNRPGGFFRLKVE